MKFRAKLVPSGNATGVEVPAEVMNALGPQARPPVAITINGHTWRSRVALMRGQALIGVSAANRAAAGVSEGYDVEFDLRLDEVPRDVALPADLAAALAGTHGARAWFDGLPFGLKRKHVATIEEAKSPKVREGRIARLVGSSGETASARRRS